MELSGLLSNPDITDRLDRAADVMAKRTPEVVRRESLPTIAVRPGWARRGIMDILARASAPMTPTEVHEAMVMEHPTRGVSYATVKSALSDEAGKPQPQVLRGAEGGYRLVPQGAACPSRARTHAT